MPSTVNGIGTMYFGTGNRQVQDGVCESCHQRVKLVSYETWHCICVLFIPLIPLGKKQVLNYCPACTRHRVMPFSEWVKIRDEAIGETMTEVASSPDDPEAAMKMHATLAAFQKGNEATKFAQVIEDKFSDVANLQFYLAAWYERTGNTQAGNRLFLRAYELDPSDINFRRAALLTMVEQGDVDQAKSLIDPFLPGKENFQTAVCYALAAGYQKHGRHEEAVEMLRSLYAASPGLASDKAFRKALVVSEKALGVTELTLSGEPIYKKSGFLWAMAGVLVVAAVAGWNHYIATNRTLHVVNGLPNTPITVKIDGGAPIDVPARGRKQVTLAEGTHDAELTAPEVVPKTTFTLSSGWWERFGRRPVFIIDPSRSADVHWETTTYVAKGNGAAPIDNPLKVHLGQFFTSYNHIDYQFENFPGEIRMKNNSGSISKSRISIENTPPEMSAQLALMVGTPPAATLEFLESHLRQQPENESLLRIYAGLSMMAEREADCQKFLSKRLSDRPVRIPWHRYYQIVNGRRMNSDEVRKAHERLKQEYDAQLTKEPNEPSLLYLRGRLEDQAQASGPFFERALAADPNHPFALYATSHQRMVAGEFSEALDLLQRAVAAKPGDMEFEAVLNATRLAAKDYDGLEAAVRSELKTKPFDNRSMESLLKVLIITNRPEEADREFQTYSAAAQQRAPQMANTIIDPMKWFLSAIKGDFASLETLVVGRPEPDSVPFAFFARLCSDKLADVPTVKRPTTTGYWHLCRELVARRQGKDDQAIASRNAALDQLDQGSSHDWNAADTLRKSATITWEEIAGMSCQPQDKIVVLTALARERQDLRSKLLDMAELLNFDLEFPHYLVKREIEELRKH